MYIQIQEGQPAPITIRQLRQANPNTTFREDYPASQLESLAVFKVETDPQPAHGPSQTASLLEPTLVDGTWRRTWTVTDIPLATLRAGASLTRMEFCNNLAAAGILTDADAVQGAKGDWPAAMASFLEYLTPAQARDAQIEWATALTIRRMHPFVLLLGSWLGLTDAQMDALFGIEV